MAISGTSRPNNYTSRALTVVADDLERRGAQVAIWDGRRLALTFPGQTETDDALALRESIEASTAVVLATPEYHGTFSALTKLILENLGFPSALKGKPIALVGVAQGRIGAIKSLEQLRGVCAHLGALVLPGAVSIAGVQRVFDQKGNLTDEEAMAALHLLAGSLLDFVDASICPKMELETLVRGGAGPSWTTVV